MMTKSFLLRLLLGSTVLFEQKDEVGGKVLCMYVWTRDVGGRCESRRVSKSKS